MLRSTINDIQMKEDIKVIEGETKDIYAQISDHLDGLQSENLKFQTASQIFIQE